METIDADKQLVKSAFNVTKMFLGHKKDPVNKQYISWETYQAAVKVVGLFSTVVAEKTVRISVAQAKEAVGNMWDKFTSTVNDAMKEAERRLTPTFK